MADSVQQSNPNPTNQKTNAPESEAMSHKPTFGAAAEQPGTEQKEPEGDPTVSKTNAEDHNVAKPVQAELQRMQDMQTNQQDPDKHQRDIHQPTTQDVLGPPSARQHTIDPETGQVHYVGDTATLTAGTAAHASDEPE